jgi:hypothetical protein
LRCNVTVVESATNIAGDVQSRAPIHTAAVDDTKCGDARGVNGMATAHVPQSTQLACQPHGFLIALQARAEREKAAKQGWYRNAHGQMSFSDLAGVNIRVSSGGGGGGSNEGQAAARAPAAAAASEARATDAAGAW